MKFRRIILGLLLVQGIVYAQYGGGCVILADPNDYIDDPNVLQNGLFECGDPNLTEYDFTAPIYWERIPHPDSIDKSDCYAALVSSFDPDPNDQYNKVNWSILAPFEGDTFVLLSTGGFGTGNNKVEDGDVEGCMISQKVFFNMGDVILGAYFLGTVDYPEFNDYGRIFAKLDPNYSCFCPDPNELVINGGFDSDASWTMTGLWTITDPILPDPNVAMYNVYFGPNADSMLSQTLPFVPQANYRVSIDVLTGEFDSGSDAFTVTLGNETHNMIADANTTITQLFTPTSGNALTISWNNEGTINIDNVSVRCSDICPADEFEIVFETLGTGPNDIPAFGSTPGWVEFEYVIDEPNKVGPYLLRCEVVDYRDAVLNTYLAVDGLRICRGGKPLSDLNDDCNVNLIDYSILSEAWLSFCPDPPYDCNMIDCNAITNDANIPCQLADIYNDGFVDMDDLGQLAEDWLYNVSSPEFLTNPILYSIGAGSQFNATLKSHVFYSRPDTLVFGKVDGPDWLSVAPDGTLSGTPLISDVGQNHFTVQVDDLIHSPVQATLLIAVFTSVDIGPVGLAGNTLESEGVWTIQASGAATDPNSDECHFVYLPANGDCDVTARIDSVTEPNQLARAGVMIRETLSAGSKSVSVNMGNITSFFQYRQTTDQEAVIIEGSGQLPRWVRLVRIGDELTAYESQDGLTWGEPAQAVTVEMTPDVYIGLTATSYDNSQLTTAVITDMTIND